MTRWLVTNGDRQFSAGSIDELKKLAQNGEINAGSLIQPPGAVDWLYANQVDELVEDLRQQSAGYDEWDDSSSKSGGLNFLVAIVLLAVVAAGGYYFYQEVSDIPDHSELQLLGEGGLALTEMLVTEDGASLRKDPDASSGSLTTLDKDQRLQLLAKRGDWYQAETSDSVKGWVGVKQVVPAYMFADERTRENYDPLFNPDQYVYVKNSSWMLLPADRARNVTVFQFLLQNKSKFPMTDIKLLATIKDKNDQILETKEIPIEGTLPPHDGAMVGRLEAKKSGEPDRWLTENMVNEMATDDGEIWLRWTSGIEVQLESKKYVEANIDLLQVSAVPAASGS